MSFTRPRSSTAGAAVIALVATPLSIVALTATPAHAAPVEITIVGTNDFHGRLTTLTGPGAAKYAGAVNEIRADNPNTLFAAAGDLIGASEFESFIADDKPAIDVLNEMALDVSATGNHEFDQGYDDLVNRVMAPESPSNPNGGAEWQYIAANVDEPGDADLIPPSWTTDIAGVTVGFVGAVTEELPSLVSPAGIEGLTVTDIVDATNAEAAALRTAGADLVVMLVHEGSPSTDCATMTDPSTTWGNIVSGVSSDVNAIVSGHTHQAYACEFPVTGLTHPRPVVSAGEYGKFLDRIDFTVESTTGEVVSVTTHDTIDVAASTAEPDPGVQDIVDDAIAAAEGPGSVELGQVAGAFQRAGRVSEDATENNRGGESTLGNFVAEVHRWNTRSEERGGAEIAFMNPGGLRADIADTDSDGFPEAVTYKEAAVVQPFANTLINMDMTGAQIKVVLEQQWQRTEAGEVPTRPFLRLGTSNGFEYTYDPTRPEGDRITGMYLKNQPLGMSQTYSVTANSFLASGGDNFRGFRDATNKRDTGVVDLQGMVDYLAAKASDAPLEPDYRQHSVGVQMNKQKVGRGEKIKIDLSSLVMTNAGDVQDRTIRIKLGKKTIGKAPIDATQQTEPFDETGTARVKAKIPPKAKVGQRYITIFGKKTGTSIKVPIRITKK